MTVGSIVQATGAKPYDASNLGHLGYGASPDVVTSYEFEKMLAAGKIACPSDGRTPQRVAYIQCAGSRDENHLPYCSSECCTNTLRQMMEVKKIDPAIENAVIYKDIRAPGHMEYFFLAAQKGSRGHDDPRRGGEDRGQRQAVDPPQQQHARRQRRRSRPTS